MCLKHVIGDVTEHEAPTRRDTIEYGGTVVGAGLIAGRVGRSGSSSTAGEATADTPAESHSVTMEPTTRVASDEPHAGDRIARPGFVGK